MSVSDLKIHDSADIDDVKLSVACGRWCCYLRFTAAAAAAVCSCEQNSGQARSDPFPSITKKFRRYQNEANNNDRESAKKREKSPTTRTRETTQVQIEEQRTSRFRQFCFMKVFHD